MYCLSHVDPRRPGGSHARTDKLLVLDSCRPLREPWTPHQLSRIATPLQLEEWEEALEGHPDHRFKDYIVRGIRQGLRIGFNRRLGSAPRACRWNIRSAYEHPEVVSQYLAQECRAARVLGPFLASPVAQLQISNFGVIPKRHQPGRWRLILNLSSSEGQCQ